VVSFPAAFFKLKKLQNLDLSYNDLKSLQAEFATLPAIEVIDLSYNKNMTSIPAIMGMRYINVKNTKLNIEKLKWALGESCTILM
jgi:Leucine-rich repeat (LRR) protein